jgi:hypothetical protein
LSIAFFWRHFECIICTNVGSCAFAEGPNLLCCHLVMAQTCFLHKCMENVLCVLCVSLRWNASILAVVSNETNMHRTLDH